MIPQETKKYRLLTRSDFDGLACAMLLQELRMIEEIVFVHPSDMQTGKIQVNDKDITTNLPYTEGVFLAFDHHASEALREHPYSNNILVPRALSAAHVVYDYFGGARTFSPRYEEIIRTADKLDSAHLSLEEVLYPEGWILLGFLTDSRTGLGRFKNFRISNYQLMMNLIEAGRTLSIDEILSLPDVKERIVLYNEQEEQYKEQLKKTSRQEGNVLVTDLRQEPIIYVGNRFLRYALYPEMNISLQIMWGLQKQNTVITVGKSIFNRTSPVNIAPLLLRFGGGGHENAGTCQVANEDADRIAAQILAAVRES
ncbi:MAG TPA: exopolyphosphatase [Spirochaetales bacterium]|nr:exopolyphosphatase [Spirochaetales bacterium]